MDSNLYCLDVSGPRACYTRPENKVERVSYPVPTGSVVRSIFDSIFWKPAIKWLPTRIDVLAPVRVFDERRMEVAPKAPVNALASASLAGSPPPILDVSGRRVLRATQYLRDVRYRIYARMLMVEDVARENPGKYRAMFERRAAAGQCFNQPWLGLRDCSAGFSLVPLFHGFPVGDVPEPIDWTADLGVMLRDWNYRGVAPVPIFAPTRVVRGVVDLTGEVLL